MNTGCRLTRPPQCEPSRPGSAGHADCRPPRPTAILTPRGVAVNAVYKLLAALRELGPDDRRDILELLELELGESLD